MTTIISGTNRLGARTRIIASYYAFLLERMSVPYRFLTLEGLDLFTRTESFISMEQEYLIDADTFLFVMPEYNGSFPGILKLMIDNTDVRKVWRDKKALLVGVAEGRAGNVRGLDNLANVLNYLGVTVHPTRVHISQVSKYIDENTITNASLTMEIQKQLDEYYQAI